MGTAVAKRSIWTVIADNPFPYFDAETFRFGIAARLQAYADGVGGQVVMTPASGEADHIFRVELRGVPFPDGPGCISVDVTAYRAYGRLYISLIVDHDRLFRSLDGEPGPRLYLHDFKFVRSYGPERPPSLSELDEALEGLERARTAVQLRNRAAASSRSPLARIRLALRPASETLAEEVVEPPEASPGTESTAQRRQAVVDALRDQLEAGPRKIRIRRRRSDEDAPEDAPEDEPEDA